MTTRIPADIDQEDRILAGLTARQLVIISVPAIVLWLLYMASRSFLPLVAFAPIAIIVSGTVGTVAVLKRDGIGLDRFALAALRHHRRPRRLVAAVDETTFHLDGLTALHLPIVGVDRNGVVDLGLHGAAIICRAEALDLQLQSTIEQEATVAAFGRFCNSLQTSVQFVLHTEPVELKDKVALLKASAPAMPSLGLEQAARDHAAFLEDLTSRNDVLQRQVFVILRDSSAATICAPLLFQRANDACTTLRGAGVELHILDKADAVAAIQTSCGVGTHNSVFGREEIVFGAGR